MIIQQNTTENELLLHPATWINLKHNNEQNEVRNKTVYVLSHFCEVQEQDKRICSDESEQWTRVLTAHWQNGHWSLLGTKMFCILIWAAVSWVYRYIKTLQAVCVCVCVCVYSLIFLKASSTVHICLQLTERETEVQNK